MIRGATLIHSQSCALDEILLYLRQLTYASTSHHTEPKLFHAPSAVHLTNSFLPNSQQRGFSVKAFFAVISASTVCGIHLPKV